MDILKIGIIHMMFAFDYGHEYHFNWVLCCNVDVKGRNKGKKLRSLSLF